MQCNNCLKEIPADAQFCVHCEAKQEDDVIVPEEVTMEFFSGLPVEMQDTLRQIVNQTDTAREFATVVMVGNCPTCRGSNVDDCENDPDLEEILFGRCFDCGQVWCLECGRLVPHGQRYCECFSEMKPQWLEENES